MAADTKPNLLTVAEVADRLKLSEKTVRRKIARGQLPAVRLGEKGSQLRVDERVLDLWLGRARTPARLQRRAALRKLVGHEPTRGLVRVRPRSHDTEATAA